MHRSALGLLLILPLGACDDAAASLLEPFTSETDARAAVSAMLSALSETQPATQVRGGTVLRAGDAGGQLIDVAAPCESGGEIAFAGELKLSNVDSGIDEDFDPFDPGDLPTGADIPTIAFTYSVRFDSCTIDGIVLDGTLDYALETGWDAEAGSFDATWSYGGTIDVSGDVNGQCAFDFGGVGDMSAEDWGVAIPEGFSGDACGFDAASVLDEGA